MENKIPDEIQKRIDAAKKRKKELLEKLTSRNKTLGDEIKNKIEKARKRFENETRKIKEELHEPDVFEEKNKK